MLRGSQRSRYLVVGKASLPAARASCVPSCVPSLRAGILALWHSDILAFSASRKSGNRPELWLLVTTLVLDGTGHGCRDEGPSPRLFAYSLIRGVQTVSNRQ